MNDENRYNAIEETLQIISSEYISLSPDEMAENNEVLDELLTNLIEGCQKTNPLFRNMFRGRFYGGSYYDGLKIRRPDEYDIDIKFSIPYQDRLSPSNRNGYVNLKMIRVPNHGLHVLINKDDYLDTDKVMLWMHQTLSVYLRGRKRGKARIAVLNTNRGMFKVKFVRKGPAFIFRATNFNGIAINFDLVPCFLFGEDQWPTTPFRPNPIPEKPDFFIVPKPVKDEHIGTRYWRLSFQEQERELLRDQGRLKPTLRLLKKMRDKLKYDCISSYFIKTVLLWEVFEGRDDEFWNLSLSYVFMTILEDYEEYVRNRIPYFWYRRLKLIDPDHVDDRTLRKITMKLTNIIHNIRNNPTNGLLVAKYLLSINELKDFKREHPNIR